MIDIIIPAYNAHNTIKDTLNSIIKQTNKAELNVYIINDASNKNYQDIIRQYSNSIQITEITLEKNSGPGIARQIGLEYSKSEYIIFMDSDDEFYDCNSAENLYRMIDGNDMVIGAILIEEENQELIDYDHEGCLHGKMYRRSIIQKNNLKFNNLRNHEDNAFNQLYVLCCEDIAFTEDIVYRYKFNSNSITRNNSEKQSLMDYIESMTWLCKEIENRNIKNEYDVGRRFCLIAYYCYFNYLLDTEEFKFVYNKMSNIKKMYNKYICKLSYDDRLYLYKNFDYPVIPTITFFDFMDKIKNGE